ncbi:MAG: RNHCP domain-containing protein [Patescibacteria group bacterium]
MKVLLKGGTMIKSKKFQRTKENFTCERCGFFVRGSGYTNHCPQCLWSKHVDVNPGDRRATCQGLMEPVGVEQKGGEYIILHRCILCGFEKRNKAAKDDNFDAILKLSSHPIKQ